MFYLLLAIASSTLVSVAMRLSKNHIQNNMGMFIANYSACVILSRLFMGGTQLLLSFCRDVC